MSTHLSGWTSHGHRIDGLVQIGQPSSVARCGGPGLCAQCARESETRRIAAAVAAQSPFSETASPSPAPNPTPPLSGPLAANLGDGAIGRLSDEERAALWLQVRQALVVAWRDDYSVKTVTDGVTDCIEQYLAAIVRAHAERALAEVEQRIASSVSPNFALRHDGTEDPQAAAYVEGLHDAHEIVRAARQEQS